MFRMSDRLPVSRRRSAGGKHVALPVRPLPAEDHRPTHHAAGRVRARLAKGGIVAALTLAFGAVVVAPVWGSSSTGAAAAGVADVPATAADAATASAATPVDAVAQESASTVFVASAAVDAARQARDAATAAAVDPAQIAALDAAANELDALVGSAEAVEQRADRTGDAASRSQERTSLSEEAAATTGTADESEETDGASAGAATDAAASGTATQADTTSADTAADGAATPTAAPGTLLPGAASLSTGADRLRAAVAAVASLTQQVEKTTADTVAAQAAAAEAARVAAEQEAQRAAWKASLLGYANGRIPASALCSPGFDSSVELRCDAAEALDELDAAYLAAFGTHLDVSDSYRSYAGQVACRRTKGSLCATPGTSNHGTGVAVDLGGGVEGFGTSQFVWMTQNAAAYGWIHPDWAAASGSKPEAWHWEYTG